MVVFPLILIGAFTITGDSVASAVVRLDRVASPGTGANAYLMSVGPPGPWIPDTTLGGGLTWVRQHARLLRVTLYRQERSAWLTIDDMSLGSGDSREVIAQYRLQLFPGLDELRTRPKRTGVLRPWTRAPSITWLSPNEFFVTGPEDTLFVEHLGGSQFKLMACARMEYVSNQEFDRILDSIRVQGHATHGQGR